jgi:CBS domain-containing protein
MPTTIADIMDVDAPTVTTDAPVEEVVEVFKKTALGGVPVINDGGRCVGFITEDDLIIPDADGDLHIPHYIELFGGLIFLESTKHYEGRIKKAAAMTANDLMTKKPATIESTATPHEAAKIMSSKRHSRLPVVDHGRCVGLVTRADVLAAVTAE